MTDPDNTNSLAQKITPYSISVYGSSAGHANVSDNALVSLSYHITYKLYEILKECKTEMNVYRQSKLTNTILNNVFENYGIPPMIGNKVVLPYVSVPNTNISVLNFTKIDLLSGSTKDAVNVELEPVPFIKGLYISPLIKIHGVANSVPNSNITCPNIKIEPKSKHECNENSENAFQVIKSSVRIISKEETDYFLIISQIILNSSESLLKIALEDLRTNPRLGGVYYSLLKLIGNSIKYFKCIGKLTDRLLRTFDALLENPYIDPSSSLSVDEAVLFLCKLILEPKIANDCDDFSYRRRASCLLMRALNTWTITMEERKKILATLNHTLTSPEKMSLKHNYSILMIFYGLGCDVLDFHFWPVLNKYLSVLSSLDRVISEKQSVLLTRDISHVKSALLLVSGILYRNFWTYNDPVQQLHLLADELLYAYFGESIVPVRSYAIPMHGPVFNSSPHHKKSQSDEPLSDIRKNYRKMHLTAFRKKYPTKTVPGKMQHFAFNDIFETSLFLYSQNSRIMFNFIGSNQISSEHLKIKQIDQRYNVRCQHSSRPFLKYEKTTRCIKYCRPARTCVGDIYVFI